MKMTKKKVFVAALAICLVAIISMGTLAWFSAQDEVTNNFMIADSDDDTANEIFDVDVWEKDEDGERTDEGIQYVDLQPGSVLTKEAWVENLGYYDQYVRVTVTISDAQAWLNAVNKSIDDLMITHILDVDETNLFVANRTMKDDKITFVLYYSNILDGNDADAEGESADDNKMQLFTKVMIPTAMTREEAAAFNADGTHGFTIDVKAEAIQTENVGDDVIAAFRTVSGDVAYNIIFAADMQDLMNKTVDTTEGTYFGKPYTYKLRGKDLAIHMS